MLKERMTFDILDLLNDAISVCLHPEGFGGTTSVGLTRISCGSDRHPSWARYALPYGLMEIGGGQGLLVNRTYRPFGIWAPGLRGGFESYPEWFIAGETLDRIKAANCWYTHNYFLFGSGNEPWAGAKHRRAYFERLCALHNAIQDYPASGIVSTGWRNEVESRNDLG